MQANAHTIIQATIQAVLPEPAVKHALSTITPPNHITLIAIGKAAWRMAKAAHDVWGTHITQGVVITKYGHTQGAIGNLKIFESGHPLPDENSIVATKATLAMTANLTENDTVLLLVSGGGSAVFELPIEGIALTMVAEITAQLLKLGADIVEINTIRKRLSQVKGGRFAQHIAPAHILTLVLSDVLGDRLDSIASGPAYPDATTSADARAITTKYNLQLPAIAHTALANETPKQLENIQTHIIGNVRIAAQAAADTAQALGYTPLILTTLLDCTARDAGRMLAAIAREIQATNQPIAPPCTIIIGGETVVHVAGDGLGGRNQEIALAAAIALDGVQDVVVAAVGTDGTDGPCDAAGGVVDGKTMETLRLAGIDAVAELHNNNAYYALNSAESLLITGPTGTNVNDIAFLLVGK